MAFSIITAKSRDTIHLCSNIYSNKLIKILHAFNLKACALYSVPWIETEYRIELLIKLFFIYRLTLLVC